MDVLEGFLPTAIVRLVVPTPPPPPTLETEPKRKQGTRGLYYKKKHADDPAVIAMKKRHLKEKTELAAKHEAERTVLTAEHEAGRTVLAEEQNVEPAVLTEEQDVEREHSMRIILGYPPSPSLRKKESDSAWHSDKKEKKT